MTTGNDVQFAVQNPFPAAEEPIGICWSLGYHDGMSDVDIQIGDGAIEALATSTPPRLADLNGELAACNLLGEDLTAKTAAANSLILPHAGSQRIGRAAWIVVALYIWLAFLNFAADFPLSALTVVEALGRGINLSSMQMLYLQTAAVWSLGVTLCLIPFCLKILADVMDLRKVHHWWEMILVALACVLCGISLYGVAQMRHSMGRQQIAVQEMRAAYAAVPVDKDRVARAVTAAMKAANSMSEWTAFTLMWVTITLPVLSAISVIVAFRQIRSYGGHNRALEDLACLSGARTEQAERKVRLEFAIGREQERLKQAQSSPYNADLKQRAIAAYKHGFVHGEAARLASAYKGGLYSGLVTQLTKRRAA